MPSKRDNNPKRLSRSGARDAKTSAHETDATIAVTDTPDAIEAMTSLPASVAVLDPSGTIVAVNETWRASGRRDGLALAQSGVGANYLDYCRADDPATKRFAKQLRALLAGRLDLITSIYPCHSPEQQRWFALIGFPLAARARAGVALLHVDLTAMLPAPFRALQAKDPRPPADLDALSGAVTRSVSQALAMQIEEMLAGPPSRRQEADEEPAAPDLARLSPRQREILRLLGEGKSNKEIARALVLSPNTVKLHVSAILQRLNLRSRTHAALLSSRLARPDAENQGEDLVVWRRIRPAA